MSGCAGHRCSSLAQLGCSHFSQSFPACISESELAAELRNPTHGKGRFEIAGGIAGWFERPSGEGGVDLGTNGAAFALGFEPADYDDELFGESGRLCFFQDFFWSERADLIADGLGGGAECFW